MISTKLARIEADSLRAVRPRNHARIHVSGDCRTKTASGIVGSAMVDYERRSQRQGYNRLAFTYTHAWQKPYSVHYDAWQGARCLASIDNESQYNTATQDLGYPACTMVTPEAIPTYKTDNNLMVLCPYPKHDCRDCRLCFMSMDWLRDNRVIIMMPVHGYTPNRIQDAINGTGGCYADIIYISGLSSANHVTVAECSTGKKIKGMTVTYTSIKHTCPTTCAMYPKQYRRN